MDKIDVKRLLKQTEDKIKDLGAKAGKLAKALEKDASYGTKAGMIKIEQLALENEKNKLISQLGTKTYSLLRSKKISHAQLKEVFEEISSMDAKIRGKKSSLSRMKSSRKAKSKKK